MAKMEDIVSLCKRRGFIWQGSDVYGGMAGTWDFGPLGVALKRRIMDTWWNYWVEARDDMFGVDAAIIMNPKTIELVCVNQEIDSILMIWNLIVVGKPMQY